jgi:ABC-type lipoprotein release transport system permease subunit
VKLTFQGGGVIESTGKEGVISSDDAALVGNTTEFIVKGIVHSKVSDISSGVFITEQDYRRVTGKRSLQAQEIVIKHSDNVSDDEFKQILYAYGFQDYAKIETADEAIPKFLSDVQNTFALLGNMVGVVGLIVSSITVFIVIYINALTRRKFIGILKGIGISGSSIEISYLLQSIFYAIIGIGLGLLFLYGFLVPILLKNPIDFPMSDGVLIADLWPTLLRAGILLIVTMFAGFLPARLIVRKNTLDSILQR